MRRRLPPLKATLGIGRPADAEADAEPTFPLSVVLQPADAARSLLIEPALAIMGECAEAAPNASELLVTLVGAIAERTDAPDLMAAWTAAAAPPLGALLDRVSAEPGAQSAAAGSARSVAALRLVAAALEAEHVCREIAMAQNQCLPSELLCEARLSPRGNGDADDAAAVEQARADAPFAALVGSRLGALRAELESSRRGGCAFAQQAAADAVLSYARHAPPPLLSALATSGALHTAATLYFDGDVRGGGRQDFLRHVLLRVLAAVLRSAQPQLLTTLLKDADLVSRLVNALAPEAGRPASSPEHARLLAIELLDSAALFPFLGELLAESGGAKGLRELTGPPLVRRSMSARSVMALQIAPVVAAPTLDSAEGAAVDEPACGTAEGSASGAADDAENINPNSPTLSPTSPPGLKAPSSPPSTSSPASPEPRPRPPGLQIPDSLPVAVLDDSSVRADDDFSKLTPQPVYRTAKRSCLPRRAKDASPFGSNRFAQLAGVEADESGEQLAVSVGTKLHF